MAYRLPDSAIAWQARIRRFADEDLIPWEVEAELNGGELPAAVRARHVRIAQELGLPGMDAPAAHGGLALPAIDQVAI